MICPRFFPRLCSILRLQLEKRSCFVADAALKQCMHIARTRLC